MALGCTERELLARISSYDLVVMEAYSTIEPFGFEMLNLMQASICCAVTAPYVKKGSTPKVTDFLFDFSKQPQTQEDMIAAALAIPGLQWQR